MKTTYQLLIICIYIDNQTQQPIRALAQSSETKCGMKCSLHAPSRESRITAPIPSRIGRTSTCPFLLHFWTLFGILSENVKFWDDKWKRKRVMSSQRRHVTLHVALHSSKSSQFYKWLTFMSAMRNLTEKSWKMLLKWAQLSQFGRRCIVLRNIGWNLGFVL